MAATRGRGLLPAHGDEHTALCERVLSAADAQCPRGVATIVFVLRETGEVSMVTRFDADGAAEVVRDWLRARAGIPVQA